MPDFRQRSTEEEVMDDLGAEGYELEQSLRELAVINKWLGGQRVLKSALNELKPIFQDLNRPVKIVDLGCGGGDLLAFVKRWAYQASIPVSLYGYDANPHVVQFARELNSESDIEFKETNILDPDLRNEHFDVVLLTLFCHHLPDQALVALLQQLKKQTSVAIVINDLHRHPLAYQSIKLLTNLFSKTLMVKADAPQSVLRAFTRHEFAKILKDAGFIKFSIQWQWAFRWKAIAYPD